jgi:crotonobetainyl-CoA:carnitine CoA-transferase CaiB-like acyl-CoA transferase
MLIDDERANRSIPHPAAAGDEVADELRVLEDIVVVDCGVGMAAALISKFLREAGARVIRVAPGRCDPFDAIYAAHPVWRLGVERDDEAGESPERLDKLLAAADVLLTGGEDHPLCPRRGDQESLCAQHPSLIVLEIEAYPGGTADAGRAGTDILVQARSGLAYEQLTSRPIAMGFEPSNYGAALQGLTGLFAALYERELSGLGQVVRTSLYEGALTWLGMFWVEVEKPTPLSDFVMPKDPHPTIFRGADGGYLHFVTGSAGSKYLMYQALGIDDPTVKPGDAGLPQPGDPKNFFGPVELYAEYCARLPRDELLKRMLERGLPAAPVLEPGQCWDEPQIAQSGVIVSEPDGLRHVGNPLKFRRRAATRKVAARSGARPLEGVRIVDFGAFVAGPLATAVLADLGADVIKVELPGGDPCRHAVFRSFTAANHGKRAIALDLKHPEAMQLIRELLRTADAVTSNFRPGASARLGIDPASLHAIRADLVVLESPAYGSAGPLADRAGFDMIMQAFCGHEYRGGGRGNVPLWNRTGMVDTAAGMLGAIAVLAGLYHRARRGEGVDVESPLVNAGVWLLSELIRRPDGRFAGAEPLNAECTGYRASEAMYRTRDGWIAVVVRGRGAATGFASALALGGVLGEDPLAWGSAQAAAIRSAIGDLSSVEALSQLRAGGAWVEECSRNAEMRAMADSSLERLGIVRTSTHERFGKIKELAPAPRFSRSRTAGDRAVELLGASTREVLRELGCTDDRIADLVERKIAFAPNVARTASA